MIKYNSFLESETFKPTDIFRCFFQNQLHSVPFESKEPKCVLYIDGDGYLLNDSNYSMNDEKKGLIQVIPTNFTNMINNINGMAIHIDICGLLCNRTLFIDCVTSE